MEKKPFIPKEGKGRLFRNTRKETNAQPDWRGDAMSFGTHIQISGWDQEDGSISLSIQKKEDRQGSRRPDAPQQREAVDTSYVDNPAPKKDLPF